MKYVLPVQNQEIVIVNMCRFTGKRFLNIGLLECVRIILGKCVCVSLLFIYTIKAILLFFSLRVLSQQF